MIRSSALLILGASLLLVGCGNHASPDVFSIDDIDGQHHQPLRADPGEASVIIFATTDCPIGNKFCPEIERIYAHYDKKQVRLILAHVDPDVTPASARRHAKDYGLTCPITIDARHEMAKETGVTRTPEAVVITGDGRIAYRGRINDQFHALGDRKNQISSHDLRNALDAVLEGAPVPVSRTEAVGCTLPSWE